MPRLLVPTLGVLLCLFLVGSLIAPSVLASHDAKWRWYKGHVRLEDHTAEALDGYVEIIAHNWNAAAGGGVTLDYVRMPPKENCAGVTQDDGMIKVCSFSKADVPSHISPAGQTNLRYKKTPDDRQKIISAKVMLVADTWNVHSDASGYWWHPLGCHEVGHALGLQHWTDEQTSCMGTQLQTPGSHDATALKKMYGGNGGQVFDLPILCCTGLGKYGVDVGAETTRRAERGGVPDGRVHGDLAVKRSRTDDHARTR